MSTPTHVTSHPDTPPPQWGSDYLAALMRHLGLEYVALNPGASYRGLHDSLVNYPVSYTHLTLPTNREV